MMQLRKTRRRKGRLCHIKLTTVTDIHCFQRLVPQSPSIHRSLIPKKFCKIVELLYFLRWSVCRYSSNGRHNIQTFEHCAEDDVLVIEVGAWAGPRGDQELDVSVIRVELDVVFVVVLGEVEGEEAGAGMGQSKGLGIDGLGVSGETRGAADVAGLVALVAGEEELAGEKLVDESALVGGGGAHGLEVGDGEGDVVAVQAEDEPAQRERVGAEDGF